MHVWQTHTTIADSTKQFHRVCVVCGQIEEHRLRPDGGANPAWCVIGKSEKDHDFDCSQEVSAIIEGVVLNLIATFRRRGIIP
jgi:hypothetical protein